MIFYSVKPKHFCDHHATQKRRGALSSEGRKMKESYWCPKTDYDYVAKLNLMQLETWGFADEYRAHPCRNCSDTLVRCQTFTGKFVENGSNVEKALLAKMMNYLAAVNWSLSKERSEKLSFNPQSCFREMSSFCSSKVISYPACNADLNGSLIQWNNSVNAEGKWRTLLTTDIFPISTNIWRLTLCTL